MVNKKTLQNATLKRIKNSKNAAFSILAFTNERGTGEGGNNEKSSKSRRRSTGTNSNSSSYSEIKNMVINK